MCPYIIIPTQAARFLAVWGGVGGRENSEIGFSPLFPSLPEGQVPLSCALGTVPSNNSGTAMDSVHIRCVLDASTHTEIVLSHLTCTGSIYFFRFRQFFCLRQVEPLGFVCPSPKILATRNYGTIHSMYQMKAQLEAQNNFSVGCPRPRTMSARATTTEARRQNASDGHLII